MNEKALQAVYQVFVKRMNTGQLPPTIREVVEEAGVSSTSVASDLIDELVSQGKLEKAPGRKSRGVTLPQDEWNPVNLRALNQALKLQLAASKQPPRIAYNTPKIREWLEDYKAIIKRDNEMTRPIKKKLKEIQAVIDELPPF